MKDKRSRIKIGKFAKCISLTVKLDLGMYVSGSRGSSFGGRVGGHEREREREREKRKEMMMMMRENGKRERGERNGLARKREKRRKRKGVMKAPP